MNRHKPPCMTSSAMVAMACPTGASRSLHFGKDWRLPLGHPATGASPVIEVEVQNETHQSQQRMRFSAVPRIGEGIRLLEPSGFWVSYDVVDVWYQKAQYGDVWEPFLHVRITPAELEALGGQVSPLQVKESMSFAG
jgi:hypothetical protein